jgi:hypothetical protein
LLEPLQQNAENRDDSKISFTSPDRKKILRHEMERV